jgi:GPH family glycoside/pentoside/hexuronide:cation symporter
MSNPASIKSSAGANSSSIGLREKVGYACGDTASVLYYRSFAMFLMYFYTDVFGMAEAMVATMFLVTRFWDAFNDPLMGIIADRTRSRFGKFRPWLRWMLLPWVVSGILVFTVPDLGQNAKIIYAWVTYIASGMVYTAINIPYGALMGVISPHRDDRTVLASYRFYGAYLGDFIVKGSMLWLVLKLGGGDEAVGFQRTMILYAGLSSILFLGTFYATKERVLPPADQKSDVFQDLSELLRNGPWLAISGMGICTLLWISVRDGATLYFFKYYVGNFEKWATIFLVSGTAATFAGVALTKWATHILGGKRPAFIVLTLIVSAISSLFYFVRADQIVFILLIQIIASLVAGPLMPLFWSMVADTADFGEWKNGRRITGLTFSAGTFSQKAGWAIGGSIAGFMLAAYGYEANVQQTPEAIGGIRLMMGAVPAVIGLFTAGLGLLYRIDGKLEAQIEADLRTRRLAGVTGDTQMSSNEPTREFN